MDSFKFYKSFWKAIEPMPNEDKGELLTAICKYAFEEKRTELRYPLCSTYEIIIPLIDSNKLYQESGKKGGLKRGVIKGGTKADLSSNMNMNMNMNNNVLSNTNSPSLDDIKAYSKEIGMTEKSATKFYDYYSSTGWKTSKGSKVTDWKARMKAWKESDEKKIKNFSNFKASDRNIDAEVEEIMRIQK